jgi:hypothetical protein
MVENTERLKDCPYSCGDKKFSGAIIFNYCQLKSALSAERQWKNPELVLDTRDVIKENPKWKACPLYKDLLPELKS